MSAYMILGVIALFILCIPLFEMATNGIITLVMLILDAFGYLINLLSRVLFWALHIEKQK